jgi:uncharacterized protein with WD repeat
MMKKLFKKPCPDLRQISREDTSLSTGPKPNKKENAPRERTPKMNKPPVRKEAKEIENLAEPDNPESMLLEKNLTLFSLET